MNSYLLFKSLHLISVISWMVGLLYLPRIFVYHAQNTSEEKTSEIFKTMERKLFLYIMTPAMILSWIFGIILIHSIGFSVFLELLMQIKTIAVIILTVYHFSLGSFLNDFAIDDNGSNASLGFTITNHFGNFEKVNGRTTSDTSQQRYFLADKGMEFSALTVRDIKWGRT